jgi:hypothetical protein
MLLQRCDCGNCFLRDYESSPESANRILFNQCRRLWCGSKILSCFFILVETRITPSPPLSSEVSFPFFVRRCPGDGQRAIFVGLRGARVDWALNRLVRGSSKRLRKINVAGVGKWGSEPDTFHKRVKLQVAGYPAAKGSDGRQNFDTWKKHGEAGTGSRSFRRSDPVS